jgi:exosortase
MASDRSCGAADRPGLRVHRPVPVSVATVAGLVVFLAYLEFFRALLRTSATHPYAGHLIFVPLFAAGLVWMEQRHRGHWPRRHTPFAAGIVGAALGILGVAYATDNVPLQAVSFVGSVGGLILWIFGPRALRELRFVLVFLFLMTPPPREALAAVAPAIQHSVATVCGVVLRLLEIPVEQRGIFLHLPGLTLEVAEECAGLRFSLILFVFVAAFARAVLPTARMQLVLIALSVPVALSVNTLRVAITGVGAHVIGPHIATGPAHYYIGKGCWAFALLTVIGIAYVLRVRARRGLADRGSHYVVAASACEP